MNVKIDYLDDAQTQLTEIMYEDMNISLVYPQLYLVCDYYYLNVN